MPFPPKQFHSDRLAGILDGAPLLKDIQRYHDAANDLIKRRQNDSEEAHRLRVEEVKLFHKITLGSILTSSDPRLEFDRILLQVESLRDRIEAIETGERYAKHMRAADSLDEVYDGLSARIKSYMDTLPIQRATAMRFQNESE